MKPPHTHRHHRITLFADTDQHIWVRCSQGDYEKHLGAEPTPDAVIDATHEHWGRPMIGAT